MDEQVCTRIELIEIHRKKVFVVRGAQPTIHKTADLLDRAGFRYDSDDFPGMWAALTPDLTELPSNMWVPHIKNHMILYVEMLKHKKAGFEFVADSKAFTHYYAQETGCGMLISEKEPRIFWDTVAGMRAAVSMLRKIMVFTPYASPDAFMTVEKICTADREDNNPGLSFTYLSGDGLSLSFAWAARCERDKDYDEDTTFTATHRGGAAAQTRTVGAQ